MNSPVFEKRMAQRRTLGLVIGLIGAGLAAGVTWVLVFFTLVVAVPLTDAERSVVVSIVVVTVLIAYLAGWAARSFFSENIDTHIASMGPIRKRLLIGAIAEDLGATLTEEELNNLSSRPLHQPLTLPGKEKK